MNYEDDCVSYIDGKLTLQSMNLNLSNSICENTTAASRGECGKTQHERNVLCFTVLVTGSNITADVQKKKKKRSSVMDWNFFQALT